MITNVWPSFHDSQCVYIRKPNTVLQHKHEMTCISNRNWQDAQLSQRDRATGCVNFGQKWKTGTGRQYVTDII